MSRLCPVTGKRPRTGNNVSHANNRTKRRFSSKHADPQVLAGERKTLGASASQRAGDSDD